MMPSFGCRLPANSVSSRREQTRVRGQSRHVDHRSSTHHATARKTIEGQRTGVHRKGEERSPKADGELKNHRVPRPTAWSVLRPSQGKKVRDVVLLLRAVAEDENLTISAPVAFAKGCAVLVGGPTSDRHARFLAASSCPLSEIETIAKRRAVFHRGAGGRIQRSRSHRATDRGCRARAQRDHKYIEADVSHACSPFLLVMIDTLDWTGNHEPSE